MSAVGTDIRGSSRPSQVQYSADGTPSVVSPSLKMPPPPPLPIPGNSAATDISKGFMKPAGVDTGLSETKSKSKSKRPVDADADADVVDGAREKKRKRKKEKGLVAPTTEA